MTIEIQDKTMWSKMHVKQQSILGMKQVFPESRVRRKNRMFDYERADDSSRLHVEVTFKLLFLLVLSDPVKSFSWLGLH